MTAIAALMILQRPAHAGPTGGTVVQGTAGIQQSATTTNINQSSSKAIINWQGFSVGAKETVNFNQPGSSSVTLNRVIGNETSVISGAVNANGQVFIVNSAGVLFGKSAQVNVGGLVASTLDISNENFMAGKYSFSGNSAASVVNQGHIHASPGGYVSLLGKTVANDGVIVANLGTVALASGQQITLNFGGNSLVDVTIDKGALNALVSNKRAIIANGGTVIMTAKAADEVLSAQVNNSGVIQARTIASLKGGSSSVAHKGSIKLLAEGGTVHVSGRLDASAPKGGDGGFIETSGNRVTIADEAVITTKAASGSNGTWLIDPDGFTIAAIGGDITGTFLSSQLASNNVTIASTSGSGADGNLNVNATVTWLSNTVLTLNATKTINVNAVISGANGGLKLNAGTDINVNAPSSLKVAMLTATAGNDANINAAQTWTNAGAWTFAGKNINVNDTVNWSAGTLTLNAGSAGGFINLNAVMTASNAAGLVVTYNTAMDTSTVTVNGLVGPSSTYGTPFGGINPLFDPASGTFVGRIDFVSNTAVGPLKINGNSYQLITSMEQLAGLSTVLRDGNGNIAKDPNTGQPLSYTTASGYYALAKNLDASGTTYIGPVVYQLTGALEGLGHTVSNLTITPAGVPNNRDGNNGLIGTAATGATVRDIGVLNVAIKDLGNGITGDLGGINEGGLVASNGGTIINAFAVGGQDTITIPYLGTQDFPTQAAIAGRSGVGGLVGNNTGIIVNSHADVNVYGHTGAVGGLVGQNIRGNVGGVQVPGIIINSYATGAVSGGQPALSTGGFLGSNYFGGFVGYNNGGVISNSYATGTVTTRNGGGVGGFAGYNANRSTTMIGTLNNVFSSGAVTVNWTAIAAPGQDAGGLVGVNSGDINNSNTTSRVIANSDVPGFQNIYFNNVGALVGRLSFQNNHRGNTNNSNAYGTVTTNVYGTDVGVPGSLIGFNQAGGNVGGLYLPGGTPPSTPQNTMRAAQQAALQRAADARATAQTLTQQAGAQQLAVAQAIQQATTAANVIASTDTQISAATPPTSTISSAGKGAVTGTSSVSVEDGFKAIENSVKAQEQRERRRIATTRPRGTTQRDGNFGATIRTIDVDGQRFNLRKDAPTQDAPAQPGR